MSRRVRQVKSEVLGGFIATQIKTERCKTPLRFSRRLRHLPPEDIQFYYCIREGLRKEHLEGKHIISQESSMQFRPSHNITKRKLHYPQKSKHSKEVISILSAPKFCNKKLSPRKRTMTVSTRFRGPSCKPKLQKELGPHYSLSKINIKIKKENSPGTEKILKKRRQYVLEVLNRGDLRDIEKLPTVGSKTAEMIVLYRQLKGCITKISELAKMPKFPKRRFHNFVAQNFLTTD